MNELPLELNIPHACPRCGDEWVGYGTSPEQVTLFFEQNHVYKHDSSDAEVLVFEEAIYSEKHLAREVWLVGATEPWPRMPPLPPHAAVKGFGLNIKDEPFVVVNVESNRVWLQKAPTGT